MKTFFAIFSFVLICATYPVKAQEEELLHKTSGERVKLLFANYWDSLGLVDSTNFFSSVNKIKKVAIDNNDDDLLLDARLLNAIWLRYHSTSDTLILSSLDNVYNEAAEKNKFTSQIISEYTIAEYNFHILHQYEIAFEHLQKVYMLMKNLSDDAFPLKKFFLYGIVDYHYVFSDYRDAIFYYQEAFRATSSIEDKTGFMITLNTVGLCYRELNLLDSSDYCFKESYQQALKIKSRAWQGICSGNLGYNYFLRKKYDEAIPLLQKDVDIALETKDWGLASGSLMPLAAISLLRNDITKADQQLQQARQYVYISGQYKRLAILYPLLSKLYAAKGDAKQAAIFLDSSIYVRDSVAKKFNALQILRAQQTIEREQQKAEVASITSQQKIAVMNRNILIAVVVLTMLLAIYIFKQQQKKQNQNKAKLLEAEGDLKLATKQLADFTNYISEKNSLIETLQKQLEGNEEEALQKLRSITILTEDEWEYFRQIFEKVHGGYLQRFKEKFPALTPAETRFMALSKLKLSNKEMAAILGVSTQAMRVTWHRLRKKLGLPEESNINELIDSL